ncbi:MAG: patatin-like phospholipase family protein [Prevotella sp.]|nr:patatin-like phospholipase family protein [Prevotella sp.]
MKRKVFLLLFVMLTLCCICPTNAHTKVGLALSGGGAKGAATIGALRVIEKSGIKIDYIAGTSIGAVIGGLYASGFTLDEIERFLFTQGKLDVLDINYIESELRRQLRNRRCENIQDTHIPFRCVAVDGDNMKEYVLSEGKLWTAILASMSVPVIYPFVSWKNLALYDGGLLNNLPVDVVKDMGADIVIAIDLQQNEDDGLEIPSLGFGGIFDTLADWSSTHPEKKKYRLNVKAADIHIHPRLPGFKASSFGRQNCETMKKIGEEEAEKHWSELQNIKCIQH